MIFVISGPGGVGKGTVIQRMMELSDLKVQRSWTSRDSRSGEAADAYNFVTREQFEAHITVDGFLEWAEFNGNYYGTPWPSPEQLQSDEPFILEIDTQGAAIVRDKFPPSERLHIFITIDEETQARRLQGRGDPPETAQARIELGRQERECAAWFDHTIINYDVDETAAQVIKLIKRG
jgi:guanylate kinase